MSSNFLNPYFSVVIKSKIFDSACCLTSTKIINSDIPTIDDYYPIASGMEVNIGLSYINEFEISLSPDLNSWYKLLESDYLNIGNEVYLEYGYSNPRNVRYIIGQILSTPSVSFGTSPSFKISAKGVGFKGLLSKTDVKSVNEYVGKTFNEVIDIFARANGITAIKRDYDTELGEMIIKDYPVEGSDWHRFSKFLYEHNCYFYQFGESLEIMGLDKVYMKDISYTLVWGGKVSIKDKVYPIIEFEVNPEGIFLPQDIYLAENLVEKYQDVYQKVNINELKLRLPSLDTKSVYGTKYVYSNFNPDDIMSPVILDFGDGNIKNYIMNQLLMERANRIFSGSVSTIGNVDLLPGIIVDIKGFGKLLDGKYIVFNVSHTIDSKGYFVNMEIKKNAFSELQDAVKNTKVNLSNQSPDESDVIDKEEIAK